MHPCKTHSAQLGSYCPAITTPSLPRHLDSVSECLAFMDAHPSYQDAATYRAKYLQLQVGSDRH